MVTKSVSTPPTLPTTPINRKSRKRNLRWVSLIGPFGAGDYQVVPLTSSKELREEGELMNHCVGRRYHRWCHVGAVRVFSVRDLDGRRVATASIYYDLDEDRWRIEQCKGIGNSEVFDPSVTSDESPADNQLSDIHFVVQELAALYQRAQEIQDVKEQSQQKN
ncbi:MAG: PcfJ domain-containing protein [Rhodocyclales bacterium]|nr:PcfJ domain-containing protein [Rhodocyclales bacterium]